MRFNDTFLLGRLLLSVSVLISAGLLCTADLEPSRDRAVADWHIALAKAAGIDAFAFYSTFSNFRADRYERLVGRYRYLTELAHRAGKRMMLPVHPGHDNSYFRDDGDFYDMPRRDDQTLRDYLRAASDAGADYVMVTSWNEWPESTVIEPAAYWDDPYQYLRILAEWRGKKFIPIPPPR